MLLMFKCWVERLRSHTLGKCTRTVGPTTVSMGPYPCGVDMRPGSCDCQLPTARVRMLRIQLVFNMSWMRLLGPRVFGWRRRVPARMPPSSCKLSRVAPQDMKMLVLCGCSRLVVHVGRACNISSVSSCVFGDTLSGDVRLSIVPVLCKRSLPGIGRVQLYFRAVPILVHSPWGSNWDSRV